MTKTILVVDDDPDLLASTAELLQESGYQVVTASDAIGAVSAAQRARPDLIIMDYRLPAGSGLNACEKIRNRPGTAGIPILFLTAFDTEELKNKALQSGAQDFLGKPFQPQELLARVQSLLG